MSPFDLRKLSRKPHILPLDSCPRSNCLPFPIQNHPVLAPTQFLLHSNNIAPLASNFIKWLKFSRTRIEWTSVWVGNKWARLAASSLQQQSNGGNMVQQSQHSPTPIEPPSWTAWTVAADKESRLEHVCETADRKTSVDLTARAIFSIGRSPSCNNHLFHKTSSWRHALLFRHPHGSCYTADCKSTHGTYINGVCINHHPSGRVIPHKLKRGAMVRLGGPDSPSYVLKSFSTSFDSLAYRSQLRWEGASIQHNLWLHWTWKLLFYPLCLCQQHWQYFTPCTSGPL